MVNDNARYGSELGRRAELKCTYDADLTQCALQDRQAASELAYVHSSKERWVWYYRCGMSSDTESFVL